MSIIEESKTSAKEQILRFQELRDDYLSLKKLFEEDKDNSERDAICEKIELHERLIQGIIALDDLEVALVSTPYPKKRARFFSVACTLMPNLKIGRSSSGRNSWATLFFDFYLPRDYMIAFPAKEESVDISEVEEELLRLAGDKCWLFAKESAKAMPWSNRSKVYLSTKKALESRGWVWKLKKVEGVATKVIVAPR